MDDEMFVNKMKEIYPNVYESLIVDFERIDRREASNKLKKN
jgi:hypothetical protein